MTQLRTSHVSLVRGDGVAIWRRIADAIEAEIATRGLEAGARLATEAELAARFGVNRHTVRRALQALAEDGVVAAAQGRGTFVAEPRIPYPIGPQTRFSAIMASEGRAAGGELLEAESVPAKSFVAERLNVPDGAPVLRVRFRRLSDGTPISLATSHLPLPRFAGFAAAFAAARTITGAFAACGVPDYRRVETRVTARAADDAEADALDLGPERILLVTHSVSADLDGQPVQVTEALFAASRIELVIDSGVSADGFR